LQIAEFKHKLELAAAERNFRFSKVFEKTADAIASMHQKLLDLNDALNTFNQSKVGLDTNMLQLAESVEEKWQVFVKAFK